MIKKINTHKGFSILELVIAMTVLAVGLIPIISLIINVNDGITNRELQIKTMMAAQNLMEEVMAKKWDELSSEHKIYVSTGSFTLGLDATPYNDVDDYNNYTDTTLNITRAVQVHYVNCDINSDVTTSATPTDFKQVTITATNKLMPKKPIIIERILVNGES